MGDQLNGIDAEAARGLVADATRAPSSHNTQPWRFAIAPDGLALYADRSRALPENDPCGRELTISCGCALMNLRVAAAHAGYAADCHAPPDADRDLLTRVRLSPEAKRRAPVADLYAALQERRTHRKGFLPDPPAALPQLTEAAEAEGAWLHAFDDPEGCSQVAELVAEGDAAQWADPRWRRELAAWLRPRRRGDGLPVPALIAPLVKTMVCRVDMGRSVARGDRAFVHEAPALALLGTVDDTPAEWLRAGQAVQRVLLNAAAHGLQAGYLNQPIQVARLRPKLAELTGRGGHPQLLLRLGFPAKRLPPSPRRDLDDVIVP